MMAVRALPGLLALAGLAGLIWAAVAGEPWLRGAALGVLMVLAFALLDPRNWRSRLTIAEDTANSDRAPDSAADDDGATDSNHQTARRQLLDAQRDVFLMLESGGRAENAAPEAVARVHAAAGQLYRQQRIGEELMIAIVNCCYLRRPDPGADASADGATALARLSAAITAAT